jgi:hypothetical protein
MSAFIHTEVFERLALGVVAPSWDKFRGDDNIEKPDVTRCHRPA